MENVPEVDESMTPGYESEGKVSNLLTGIGLHLVSRSHTVHRNDGSMMVGIDLVLTYGNATFIVEITENAQEDVRRRKYKMLREWLERGVVDDIVSDLKLPPGNYMRIVYISLATKSQEPVMDGKIVSLHYNHMMELVKSINEGKPDYALRQFLGFCGMEIKSKSDA